MFDTTRVFERSFTKIEGGYLYYPWRWSSGYLLSEREHGELVKDWRRVAGFRGLLKLVFASALILTGVHFAAEAFGRLDAFSDAAPLVLGIALAAYVLWRSLAANRLVRGRVPVAPPRSRKVAETAMGRALGRPLAIWMALVSLSFLGWAILFAIVSPLWGVPVVVGVAFLAFLNLRIAYRAFRPDSSDHR